MSENTTEMNDTNEELNQLDDQTSGNAIPAIAAPAVDDTDSDSDSLAEEETESIQDKILDDEISAASLAKAKKRVIDAIAAEKMAKEGLSEEDAFAAAREYVEGVLTTKREQEKYNRGEFDHDFLKVYMNDSFLGNVSMEISKIADPDQATAYIGVIPHGRSHEIVMGFNPKFFRTLTSEQRQGVIKHELYHLIFQHIFSRAIGDREYQTLWNWATDMAINSIIGKANLPDACLIPGHMPINPKTGKPVEGPYAEFMLKAPPMKSSDYYFAELRKIQEQNGKDSVSIAISNGMGTLDDHDRWDDLPADVQEAIRDKVNGMLDRAVKNAERSNDWGSVPHEIQAVIRKMLSREIDWRGVVRNFVGRCRTMDRISTVRKLNKKLPYGFPGVKRKYVANFACFIDQSGSMSDKDISLLFSELESFANHTQLDVYHFDTEIDEKSHTVWKKGSQHPPHRTRCGGTDFQAVANFCNRRENRGKWSGVIILTDGYAPKMGQIMGAKTLWVITETGTMEAVRQGDLAVKMSREKTFKRY